MENKASRIPAWDLGIKGEIDLHSLSCVYICFGAVHGPVRTQEQSKQGKNQDKAESRDGDQVTVVWKQIAWALTLPATANTKTRDPRPEHWAFLLATS